MSSRIITLLATLLMVSLAANVVLWQEANKPAQIITETYTDYIIVKDTVPMAKKSIHTGEVMAVKTAVQRHAANHEPDAMAVESEPDTVPTVSINGDSATVTLPVEQRVYQDSFYTAYVSGYNPRLDSITLRMTHTYTTVTRQVNKPSKQWAIGPTVGAGYGITGKKADLFVGVSVTWNILP